MRSPHSAATRRRWAEERRRRAEALECGEANRPDARAMFLAGGDLLNARKFEAKAHRTAREARQRVKEKERQREYQEAAERHLELLKSQQAEALMRGELTPEKAAEFREARRAMTAPPRRSRRKRLADLANEPTALRGGAGVF